MKSRLMALLIVVAAAAGVGLYVSVAWDSAEESADLVACTRYTTGAQILMAPQAWVEASQATVQATVNGSGEGLGAFNSNNFIDDYIMQAAQDAGVPLGAVASDEEFVRRLYLDMTGRQATVDQAKAFIDDPNPNKRSALIAALLDSEDFTDRMTWWYGEMLRQTNVFGARMVNDIAVRNAYYQYVRDSVANNKPWNQFMHELVTATGDNRSNPAADPTINYIVRARRTLGDKRDAMDEMVNMTSRIFLGVNTECINCHNGQRHLEGINEYLVNKTRADLWGMSAFFSALNFTNNYIPQNPPQNSEIKARVQDDDTLAAYDRNGGGGIRPARCGSPCTDRYVYPKYMFNGTEVGDNYRPTLADLIEGDPQFARAGVNNFWKLFLGIGIVEPIYGFDLAKPDQPSNPALLDRLAQEFRNTNYDVKALASLILNSNTYQTSAYWPASNPPWQDAWGKYNVRHLVRRLEPEQVVDTIMQATNIGFDYGIPGISRTINWVNQFPDTSEPQNRSSMTGGTNIPAGITNILSGARFDRGNRFNGGNPTGRPSPPVGSIMQVLTLMNDSGFINMRLRATQNGSRSKDLLARIQANPDDPQVRQDVVAEIYLAALNRRPTEAEMKIGLATLENDPRTGIEDLMWTMVNSLPFIFN